jgi:hypothetical protein
VPPAGAGLSPTEWRFAQTFAAASYVVVPLVVAGQAIGGLYCDRVEGDAVPRCGHGGLRVRCEGCSADHRAQRRRARHGFHTAEFKRDAVLRLFAGERLEDVATSLAVEAETLDVWRREFLEGAMARLSQ